MKRYILLTGILIGATLLGTMSSCTKTATLVTHYDTVLTPYGPAPAWGPDMSNGMLVLIQKYDSLDTVKPYSVGPSQAVTLPTLNDAYNDIVSEHQLTDPIPTLDTEGINIPVTDGSTIHARVYLPGDGAGYKVIVYYHGGGWVTGDINEFDRSARSLAYLSGAVVVSVAYRTGIQKSFPTAFTDAVDAYKWILANQSSVDGDSTHVGVAGEDAGANLACNVSLAARDNGFRMPTYQVLIDPIASSYTSSNSYNTYADAEPQGKSMIQWDFANFLNDPSQINDPRISLVTYDLHGLPSTTIINSEINPLLDDGQVLQEALQKYGTTVYRSVYNGVTDQFFGFGVVVPQAASAEALAGVRFHDYL